MSNQAIPIDPNKKDDIYYRYKMPPVQTKVEGSGNGIKTVIPNIHDICLAINRPEEVLMKFFQSELGAQRTVLTKDDKFLLMGSHPADRMQEKIYDFIKKFVLCKHCRNPETAVDLEQSKKKGVPSISMVCGACGKRSPFDEHRVTAIMATYYEKHPEEAKTAKGAAEARAKSHAEEDASTSSPTVNTMRKDDFKQSDQADYRVNPAVRLSEYLEECGSDTNEIIQRVVRLFSEYNMEEIYSPAVVLGGLLVNHESDFLERMKKYSELLRRFSSIGELYRRTTVYDEKEMSEFRAREGKIQILFLKELQSICKKNFTADKLPAMILLCLIEGILQDSAVVAWQSDPTPLKVLRNPELDAEMKAKVKPIVEWLAKSNSA